MQQGVSLLGQFCRVFEGMCSILTQSNSIIKNLVLIVTINKRNKRTLEISRLSWSKSFLGQLRKPNRTTVKAHVRYERLQ